jgi:hypothetical protein
MVDSLQRLRRPPAADPHARLRAQLAAVRQAIVEYDDWARLPPKERRARRTPALRRESLEALARALTADLTRLDQARERRRAA